MKKCKKLLCLVLALVMALSLCTVAMAEGPEALTARLNSYYYGGTVSGISVDMLEPSVGIMAVSNEAKIVYKTDDAEPIGPTNYATDSWIGESRTEGYYLKVEFKLAEDSTYTVLPTGDDAADKYKLNVLYYLANGDPFLGGDTYLNDTPITAEVVLQSNTEGNTVNSVTAYFPLPTLAKPEYSVSIPLTKNVEQKGNVAPGETTFDLQIKPLDTGNETTLGSDYDRVNVTEKFTYVPGTSDYAIKVSGPKAVVDDYLANGFFVREISLADDAWECDTQWWFVQDHRTPTDGELATQIVCFKVDDCTAASIPVCEGTHDQDFGHEYKVSFTNTYTENTVVEEAPTHETIRRQHTTPVAEPEAPAETTAPVTSAKTGDMGVALYAAMALLSMSGSAWLVKRRGDEA